MLNIRDVINHGHTSVEKTDVSCFRVFVFVFSVILLAMVDSNYCFTFIDVGSFGKDSDSWIFKNSTLYKKLQNNFLNFTKPNLIHKPMSYAFVGDEAFELSINMLRLYAEKCLPINKRIFNYRLSRAQKLQHPAIHHFYFSYHYTIRHLHPIKLWLRNGHTLDVRWICRLFDVPLRRTSNNANGRRSLLLDIIDSVKRTQFWRTLVVFRLSCKSFNCLIFV